MIKTELELESTSGAASRRLVWAAVVALFVLHHDFWFWDSKTLVLGFLPIGLAYHALFSVLAAGVWAAAVRFAWPEHIEEWASEFEQQAPASEGGRP